MNATTFLRCAEVVERMVGSEPVAARWHDASALEGYTVGGLAGHLARAVTTVARYLDQPVPDAAPTDAAGYFVRVLTDHDPVRSDLHRSVRQRAEGEAAQGPSHVEQLMRNERLQLADRLADSDEERLEPSLQFPPRRNYSSARARKDRGRGCRSWTHCEVDLHHRLASDRVDPANTASVPVV